MFNKLLWGSNKPVKKNVEKLTDEELKKQYPIESKIPGWFFKIVEVSSTVYKVEGSDNWGRKISLTGTDEIEVMEKVEAQAKSINDGTPVS